MQQRPLKPHTVVIRIVSEDTYEELWNGSYDSAALVFAKQYLRTTPNVSHTALRVLRYLGNNMWQSNKVRFYGLRDAPAFQLSLF